MQNIKYKYVFSKRVKDFLDEKGIKPISRSENMEYPGLWVWKYEATPAFLEAFIEVAGKGEK